MVAALRPDPGRGVAQATQPVPQHLPWIIAGLGLAALYLPTYWNAWNGIWQTDDMGHGPIIVAIVAWLFWGMRERLRDAPTKSLPGVGWPVLAVGLVFYVFGRVFNASSVEFLSQLLVSVAVLLLIKGARATAVAWFALLYMIFLVPLPGTFVDAVTGPLKHWISVIVVDSLYALGYPVARTGVLITVGQYQLLVADACSGLHSMFSLGALGTLFMYIMKRDSLIHNAIMVLAILPIAFLSNIVRVSILVLVTYHLGDEAGQGFLHGAAGMLLMLVALVFFFVLDALLAGLLPSAVKSKSAK